MHTLLKFTAKNLFMNIDGICCQSFKSADKYTIDLIFYNVCLKAAHSVLFYQEYYKEESRW